MDVAPVLNNNEGEELIKVPSTVSDGIPKDEESEKSDSTNVDDVSIRKNGSVAESDLTAVGDQSEKDNKEKQTDASSETEVEEAAINEKNKDVSVGENNEHDVVDQPHDKVDDPITDEEDMSVDEDNDKQIDSEDDADKLEIVTEDEDCKDSVDDVADLNVKDNTAGTQHDEVKEESAECHHSEEEVKDKIIVDVETSKNESVVAKDEISKKKAKDEIVEEAKDEIIEAETDVVQKACAAKYCYRCESVDWDCEFYSFPTDPNRCRRWLMSAKRTDLMKESFYEIHKNYFLCSDHFDDVMYRNPKKRSSGLLAGAMPTIFNSKIPKINRPRFKQHSSSQKENYENNEKTRNKLEVSEADDDGKLADATESQKKKEATNSCRDKVCSSSESQDNLIIDEVSTTPKITNIKIKSASSSRKNNPPRKVAYDPELSIIPFKSGWKREVVYRAMSVDSPSGRRMADVYYYSPGGKKLRSMPEISNYLSKNTCGNLTSNNFTFFKDPIYKPPAEFVRNAKDSKSPLVRNAKVAKNSVKEPKSSVVTETKSPVVTESKNFTVTEPKIAAPKMDSDSISLSHMSLQKRKIKAPSKDYPGESAIKLPPPKKRKIKITFPKAKPKTNGVTESESSEKLSAPRKSPTTNSEDPEPLCSLNCPGRRHEVPSLLCCVCLCLFHPECINFDRTSGKTLICPRCLKGISEGRTEAPECAKEALVELLFPESAKKLGIAGDKSEKLKTSDSSSTLNSSMSPSVANALSLKSTESMDSNYTTTASQVPDFARNSSPNVSLPLTIQKNNFPTLLTSSPVSIPATSSLISGARLPSGVTGTLILQSCQSVRQNNIQISNVAPRPPILIPVPGVSTSPQAVPAVFPTPAGPPNNKYVLRMVPESAGKYRYVLTPPENNSNIVTAPTVPIAPSVTSSLNNSMLVNFPSAAGIVQTNANQVSSGTNALQLQKNLGAQRPPVSSSKKSSNLRAILTKTANDSVSKLEAPAPKPDPAASTSTDPNNESSSLSAKEKSTKTVNKKVPRRNAKNRVARKTCYFNLVQSGYTSMMCIFQNLGVRDLLSCGQVCRTWRNIINQSIFWKEINFHRIYVSDWQQCIRFLTERNVASLNLVGIISKDDQRMWRDFLSTLRYLGNLKRLYFNKVSASVLLAVADQLSNLEILIARDLQDVTNGSIGSSCYLDVGKIQRLRNLELLRLHGNSGISTPKFSFAGGLNSLKSLTGLKCLTLTSFKDITSEDVEFLTELPYLQELEIGECLNWDVEAYETIGNLTKLKKLRLEVGKDSNSKELASMLPKLTRLEDLGLILMQVSADIADAFSSLTKLTRLTIWPSSHRREHSYANLQNVLPKLELLTKLQWGIVVCDDELANSSQRVSAGGTSLNSVNIQIPFTVKESDGTETIKQVDTKTLLEGLRAVLPKTTVNIMFAPMAVAYRVSHMSAFKD